MTNPRNSLSSAELTRRQQAVLDFIREYHATFGYAPSIRNIGDAVGLGSTSSVHYVLSRLVAHGAIRCDPKIPRAIVLLEEAS